MTDSEQIDIDIDVSGQMDSRKEYGGSGKRKNTGIIWILSIFTIALVVLLVLPGDNSAAFNTEISSEELEIRDSMYTIAIDIHEYFSLNGELPLIPEDIDISLQSVTYTIEDDSSWFLMSGDSLIYYSDMDPIEFAKGEI